MEKKESDQDSSSANKKKTRPAQRLYVPPAQRTKKHTSKMNQENEERSNQSTSKQSDISAKQVPNRKSSRLLETRQEKVTAGNKEDDETNDLLDTHIKNVENLKLSPSESDIDGEQAEMHRAIVNINRKTRPLIKHVSVVKNDILHIGVIEKNTTCPLNNTLNEVSNWEDLFNDDEGSNGDLDQANKVFPHLSISNDEDDDGNGIHSPRRSSTFDDLDHVIELYDFPSTFRSQDIMQIYHEVHKESTVYIKWCDDTHALLIFSSPTLAHRALQLRTNVIKSRPMRVASLIALQVATKSDLKPAMKRPPTTMQTARRLITSHLGTRTKISKEEQEKEKEMLRKAKELKKSQRQNEKDAWEGFSRPSTA